jgi:DNA processing protein
MKNVIKSAVILSTLATPAKLGLWDDLSISPCDILKRISSIHLKTQEILEHKYTADPIKASDLIIERCFSKNINIITLWDPEYPVLLKEIHYPPVVLYSFGDIGESRKICIVGTRNSDEKSEEITQRISGRAAATGFIVVSGMALGIDRSAHIGALAEGGGSVAVLPGGVDMIYPNKNSDIYRMITESPSSAVVSEYPPGIGTAQKWTFARRNRIISGLSEAVIVVQAPLKSGAMITARYAIEQNRDLYVCPGNAFDDSYSGCNELIKQGASIFSDMNDFFSDGKNESGLPEICNSDKKESKQVDNVKNTENIKCNTSLPEEFKGKVEHRIYEELKSGGIIPDDFLRRNNFSTYEVNQAITALEIGGCIERRGNKLYKI